MSYNVHPIRECRNCAYFRPTAGRGLCGGCYRRWWERTHILVRGGK